MSASKPTRKEQILKLAQASPGIKTKDAAAILGMSSGNLGTYTTQLRKEGLLKKTRGTLELAGGAETSTAAPADGQAGTEELKAQVKDIDLPREARIRAAEKLLAEDAGNASSPPPAAEKKPAAKKTKGKSKKSASYKKPKLSKKEQERLTALVQEGFRRAESYRQEGILTNVMVIGKTDGSTIVRGVGGGAALSCFMLGPPNIEALNDPDFQAMMERTIAQLGDGDGEMMVIYNLTELDDGDGMQALMTGWVKGHRMMCAVAPLDDKPMLSKEEGSRWKDLTDKQALKLADQEFDRLEEQDEDDEEDNLSIVPLRLLTPDLQRPEEFMEAVGLVMGDPERRPELIVDMSHDPQSGERSLALRSLDSGVADQLAAGAGGEITDEQAEQGAIRRYDQMRDEALARAEQYRQEGMLTNIVVTFSADGSTTVRGAMGGGGLLAIMTGTPQDDFARQRSAPHGQLVSDLGDGQGLAAMFVNLTDIGEEDQMRALVSLWVADGSQPLCMEAPIGSVPLDSPEPWVEVSYERKQELYRMAAERAANEDSGLMMRHMPGFDESQLGASMAAVMEDDERAPVLMIPFPGQAPSTSEDPEEIEAMELLMREAANLADKRLKSGERGDAVLSLRRDGQDGQITVGEPPGEDMMLTLAYLLKGEGDRDFIKEIGGGHGIAAAFVSLDQVLSDDGAMVLMSVWKGNRPYMSFLAMEDATSIEYGSSQWGRLSDEQLRHIVSQVTGVEIEGADPNVELGKPEPDEAAVTVTVADAEPLPESAGEMHEAFNRLSLDQKLLQMALREPGMKISRASKFLGLPKKQVKEAVEQLVQAGELKKTRGTLQPSDKAVAKNQEMSQVAERFAGELAQVIGEELGVEGLEVEMSAGAPVKKGKAPSAPPAPPREEVYKLPAGALNAEDMVDRLTLSAIDTAHTLGPEDAHFGLTCLSAANDGARNQDGKIGLAIKQVMNVTRPGFELMELVISGATRSLVVREDAEVAAAIYISPADKGGVRLIAVGVAEGVLGPDDGFSGSVGLIDNQGEPAGDAQLPDEFMRVVEHAWEGFRLRELGYSEAEFSDKDVPELTSLAEACSQLVTEEQIERPTLFQVLCEDDSGERYAQELPMPEKMTNDFSVPVMKGEDPAKALQAAMEQQGPHLSEERIERIYEQDMDILKYHMAPIAVRAHDGRAAAVSWVAVVTTEDGAEDAVLTIATNREGQGLLHARFPESGESQFSTGSGAQFLAMMGACRWSP